MLVRKMRTVNAVILIFCLINLIYPAFIANAAYDDSREDRGMMAPEPELYRGVSGNPSLDEGLYMPAKENPEEEQKEPGDKKDDQMTVAGAPVFRYTIGTQDILYISVWQEPDLSLDVIVRPDGKISFPLVGDVMAVGRTITELDTDLTERLKEYIKYPEVSISVKKLGGKKVIVLGEVFWPGVYSVSGGATVMEAIALARGCTIDGVFSSVIVVRNGPDGPYGMRLNLSRYVAKTDISQNIVLQSEDIVYVPRKFVRDMNYFLTQILGPLQSGVSTANIIKGW